MKQEKRTVLTVSELAERWGVKPQTVRKMETEGKIKRVKGISGVRFNIQEIERIEETKAPSLSSRERDRLEKEIKYLRDENQALKSLLSNVNLEIVKILNTIQ